MRDVTVLNLRGLHLPVLQPFLKLASVADLQRCQPRAGRGGFHPEFLVDAENLRCLDAMIEQVAEDLHVHRRPRADASPTRVSVFGRERRASHQPPVLRFLDERIEEELRRALHYRIDLARYCLSRPKS